MNFKARFLSGVLCLFASGVTATQAMARIQPAPGEESAVKVVRLIYRLPEVQAYVENFKTLDLTLVDLDDTIRLLKEARAEALATLPRLADKQTATGGASGGLATLGLVVTDLQTVELELTNKGKLTPAIKERLKDVYDLYQDLSR